MVFPHITKLLIRQKKMLQTHYILKSQLDIKIKVSLSLPQLSSLPTIFPCLLHNFPTLKACTNWIYLPKQPHGILFTVLKSQYLIFLVNGSIPAHHPLTMSISGPRIALSPLTGLILALDPCSWLLCETFKGLKNQSQKMLWLQTIKGSPLSSHFCFWA